ncbi:MAG: CHAT domain-containing protein [Bacteroidota bacterium]
MTTDQIYHILKNGTAAELQQLVRLLPATRMSDTAFNLVGTTQQPAMVQTAFSMLLPGYVHGAHPEVGAALADALYRLGKELYDADQQQTLFLSTVLGNVDNAATAKLSLGQFERVVEQVTVVTDWVEGGAAAKVNPAHQDEYQGPLHSLKLKRVAALLQLNRVDEADTLLQELPKRMHYAYDIELNRLRSTIKSIKGSVTDGAQEHPAPNTTAQLGSDSEEMKRVLNALLQDETADPQLKRMIASLLEQLTSIDPTTQEGHALLHSILAEGESFLLGGGTNDESELAMKAKSRAASGIFVGRNPSESELRASLTAIREVYDWAKKYDNTDLLRDALYTSYLCYSRLQQPDRAADQLWELWQVLEVRRASIADLHERGRAFSVYPHLFPALCEQLATAGRTEELLEAIEGGKGRVLGDLALAYTKSEEQVDTQRVLDEPFRQLLQQQQCHYLSFFVDEAVTYAVLLSKQGTCYQQTIPLGEKHLEEFLNFRLEEPKSWKELKWMTGQEGDMTQLLRPLIEWLAPLYEQGIIDEEDHLVYCPDHHLHFFPLQYVRLGDRHWLEYHSISSIHSAASLKSILERETERPDSLLGMIVPANADVIDDRPNSNLTYFKQLEAFLGTLPLENTITYGSLASRKRFMDSAKDSGLIHLGAHGFFPAKESPYTHSGLLLGSDVGLPRLDSTAGDDYYRNEHLLSPQFLLEAYRSGVIRLEGTSLLLQACVSGHAKEGVGGDALGLEWSFFHLGAATVISACWNVNIVYATAFAERFYHYWLKEKLPRRTAHRQACLDLLKDASLPSDLPRAYYWAGFRLAGDWR